MPDASADPRDDETRFRRLVNALDHAIVWEFDDTASRYTFVSEHSALVLGHLAEEWLADPHFFERRVSPEDEAKFAAVLAKLRSGEANDLRLEHRCTTRDGRQVWVHTGIHREDEGGRRLLRGVTIDINNVKSAELRERLAREQAEDSIRQYEQVMAIVSHDLRNPLNAATLAAGAIERDPTSSPSVLKTAAIIARAASRMARLIDDLMDVSNIDARRLVVVPTRTTTDAIVSEVLEGNAMMAEEKSVVLRSPLGPSVTLHCDPKRIVQVLSNIVGNAVKFSPADGIVELQVRVDALEAAFSVHDDGPGIDPEDLPHVFDRRWQAPATASKGSGLGLFIAKGIIDAHAGRIWAESAPGKGTTFTFTLPLT
ncbi:MAG: sensory box histidine kinase/response regulator [Labilithrix sp.]|nr:sensory box histidine kinase/response regulator [Labilithrix sp.]